MLSGWFREEGKMKTQKRNGLMWRGLKPWLIAAGGLLIAGAMARPAAAQIGEAPSWINPAQVAVRTPDNHDLNWGEVARFDGFLDGHPWIARDLYRDPGAIRNPEFLNSHEELREFLTSHAEINEELRESPRWFMTREGRFQNFENSDHRITRAELDNLDNYCDAHPDLARQISANPGLTRNPEFLEAHPEFATFLRNHGGVAAQLDAHPGWMMWREHNFERVENGPAPTAPQVHRFDSYLDNHQQIANQLSRDPRLVDNPEYMEQHPGLRDYLANHPTVRTELKTHPDWFMQRERNNERHDDRRLRQGRMERMERSRVEVGDSPFPVHQRPRFAGPLFCRSGRILSLRQPRPSLTAGSLNRAECESHGGQPRRYYGFQTQY
jgi:hypothetical protein